MKLTLKILLTILLSLGFYNPEAKANHILGVDIAWKKLGNDSVEVKLVLYRRCTDGAATATDAGFQLLTDSCTNLDTSSLGSSISHTVEDITPTCALSYNPCTISGGNGNSTGSIPLGVEKHVWLYHLKLMGNCCWYKLKYQICCREGTIATNYSTPYLISESWFNNCISPGDNSPDFKNPPLIICNAGQDVYYNYGANDIDRDSLSYAMAPLPNSFYASPYSPTYPLFCFGGNNPFPGSSPPRGFNLDPITGDISFRPIAVQITVLKVMVTEWRKINGIYRLVGKTSRDMQFMVNSSGFNRPPSMSVSNYDACAGQQICITINTNDYNVDTTRLTWDQSLPNATWTTVDTVLHSLGKLCWTPNDSNVSTLPYYFTASVKDNHCPLIGNTIKSYSITVHDVVNFSTQISYINKGIYRFRASPDISTKNYNYLWYTPKLIGGSNSFSAFSNRKDTTYQFKRAGVYVVRSSASIYGCITYRYDTIVVTCPNPLALISSNDTMVCKGQSVALNTDPLSGVAPYKYEWYFNGILVDTNKTLIHTPFVSGQYTVKVISSDSCTNYGDDTVNVIIDSVFLSISNLSDISVCPGKPIQVIPAILSGNYPITYRWYKNNILFSNDSVLIDTPSNPSVYRLYAFSVNVCTMAFRDTFQVNFQTSNISAIKLNDTSVCIGSRIIVSPKVVSIPSNLHYFWYRNNILIDTNSTLTDTVNVLSTYRLLVIPSNSCYTAYQDSFKVNFLRKKLNVMLINDIAVCKGNSIQVTPAVSQPSPSIRCFWYRNNVFIDSNLTLIDTPNVASEYRLIILSNGGCYEDYKDTFKVSFLPNNLQISKLKDTSICHGNSLQLSAVVQGGLQPYTYYWYRNDTLFSSQANPITTFDSNCKIKLLVISSDKCGFMMSDSFNLTVLPSNLLSINSSTTQIAVGQTAKLFVQGAKTYNWQGSSIISNWADSVEVKPTQTTKYTFIGENSFGCPETLEIYINVAALGFSNSKSQAGKIQIYPNPANSELVVFGYEDLETRGGFEIQNLLGQTVLFGNLTENKTSINISSITPGIYFIRVGNYVTKFLKI